jgi:purine-nucleoside phosphorylase
MTSNLVPGFYISPCCDYQLLNNFMSISPESFVGSIISNDYFYQPNKDWFKPLINLGILSVDMETHVLYSCSMKNGKRALSVNTVSDHLLGGTHMSSTERQIGLNKMIEMVLDSV